MVCAIVYRLLRFITLLFITPLFITWQFIFLGLAFDAAGPFCLVLLTFTLSALIILQ